MHFVRFVLIIIGLFFLNSSMKLHAQTQKGALIKLIIFPSKKKTSYQINEPVQFEVHAYKFGIPLDTGTITYSIGPERFEDTLNRTVQISNGTALIPFSTMKEPGFLRCIVRLEEGENTYQNSCTVGIEPENIQPTTSRPSDFDSFWKKQLETIRKHPLAPQRTHLKERSTEKIDYYHVEYNNGDSKIYGILSIPKVGKKFPAVISYPGAGVRAYGGNVYQLDSCITLQIGIHGIPVHKFDSKDYYENLKQGKLNRYPFQHLESKDDYYFRKVYLGCVRAVDYIAQLPQYDGENLAIEGGSQGGALSIVTASLDKRVKYLVCIFPGMCDLTGYLNGRAGGWPKLFKEKGTYTNKEIETSRYYDVVNFAKNITIPGFYSLGYNDLSCSPTSILAAFNQIRAPKEMFITFDSGHWRYREQFQKHKTWVKQQLSTH